MATKRCGKCGKVKRLEEFHNDSNRSDGKQNRCKTCTNAYVSRKPTTARMVRNRARQRARAELVVRHQQEFDDLYEVEYELAMAEARALAALPEAQEHYAGEPPRLRTGARQVGQSALDRLDVARCSRCSTNHDRSHVCPNCGLDEKGADMLANQREDDELRADHRHDLTEAVWA